MKLANAETRARQNPKTFQIPPKESRSALRRGDHAKLIFADQERMWVLVKHRTVEMTTGRVRYAGTLANAPAILKSLHKGDPVHFGPEHVIDIDPRAAD